jgi:hypothetical protein
MLLVTSYMSHRLIMMRIGKISFPVPNLSNLSGQEIRNTKRYRLIRPSDLLTFPCVRRAVRVKKAEKGEGEEGYDKS